MPLFQIPLDTLNLKTGVEETWPGVGSPQACCPLPILCYIALQTRTKLYKYINVAIKSL